MRTDEMDKRLEDFLHFNGERLKLPESISGAIMVAIVEFTFEEIARRELEIASELESQPREYEKMRDKILKYQEALIRIRDMPVYDQDDQHRLRNHARLALIG